MQVGAPADNLRHFRRRHRAVQPVGAEQQDVSGQNEVLAGVDGDEEIVSQGAAEQVAIRPSTPNSQPLLLAGDGVVARQRLGVAAPDEVAARISDVGHGHAIEAQSASHDGGGHRDAARRGGAAGFVHMGIGGLDQAAQQAGMGSCLGASRNPATNFSTAALDATCALFLSPYPVGEREQPAPGARLLGSRGKGEAKVILVVFAHAATVGKLRVLDVQQRIVRRALHAGIPCRLPGRAALENTLTFVP